VESSRAQLLCEVAQATEQSASRAVRRLDARLDAEWERRTALEKLVSEYERRAEQAATDPQVQQALELAANEAEYTRLLRPAPASAPAVTVPPIADGATLTSVQEVIFPPS
jgi:hypothetical protein